MIISEEAKALHRESLVIDIHCHPTLKIKLFDYDINDEIHYFLNFRARNSPSDEFFQMQYDLPQMDNGQVNAIWSSVYIVEKGLVDNSDPLDFGNWLLKIFGFNFYSAIENVRLGGPFLQALKLMEKLESQVSASSNHTVKAVNPKNYSEFEKAVNEGKKCFLHTLEGAHMLGRNLPSEETYIQNLETFFNRGVCSMTLGHFMPNDVCYPVNGISPHTKDGLGLEYNYSRHENEGLTKVGQQVVKKMLELGMIVDLTHITPNARNEIFEMNNSNPGGKRPLTFTHTGIRLNCPGEVLTPTIEEIRKIRECNGTIGVIFMNYWLTGNEGGPDWGLKNIVKTIKDIAALCDGGYDNVSLGSDMDGFTQPVDDLYCASQMQRLTQAMLDAQIKPEDIKKVLGLNAIRVLKEGWGKN